MSEDYGPYGKLRLNEEEGDILIREGVLKFPSSPDEPPRLIASRCTKCGDISFPPKWMCGKCDSEEVEEYLLSNRGHIYTFTIVNQLGIPGIEVPYVLAIVKVPDDDELMIAGQLTGCEPEEAKIGMEVETVIEKVRAGMLGMLMGRPRDVIGYKFRPVKK